MRTRASQLIGRQSELQLSGNRLQAALGGTGGAVFCLGEAGIGKSRLAAELAASAFAGGATVVRGRASSAGPVAVLRPFAEALSTIERRGLLPDDELGGYRPLLSRVLPQLPTQAAAGIGPAAPVVAFAEAVLRVLAHIAEPGGCLLVLEDLHEADPESLAVLDYLVDNLGELPVGILGSLRDDPGAAHDLAVAAELRAAAEIVPLRRLDRRCTAELVVSCLSAESVAESVLELLWRNSLGNPLMVEELLYDMVDAGQLIRTADGWDLVVEPVLRPPSSLVRSVDRRVERLGGAGRRALVTGAVYGQRFPLSVAMQATQGEQGEFLDSIHAATQAQLLEVDEVPGWYGFRHPLIVSALLELVTAEERRRTAATLAEVIVAGPDGLDAQSCRAAGRLYAEAGRPEVAGELFADAARKALRTGAIESATADLTEAVRLLDDRLTPELAGELIAALIESGHLDRAIRVAESMDSKFQGAAAEQRAMIHVSLAWGAYLSGLYEQGHAQLTAVHTLVAGSPTSAARVQADVIAACLALDDRGAHGGQTEDIESLARAAAETAELNGAAEAACRAWHALGRILRQHDLAASTHCFERILRLADEHDLPSWGLFGMAGAAANRWLQNGDGRQLGIVRDRARRLGSITVLLSVEANLGLQDILTCQGSLAETIELLEGGVEQARRFGNANMVRYGLATLVVGAGQRADLSALTDRLARFGAAGGSTSVHAELADGLGRAMALVLQARDDEARELLTRLAGNRSDNSPYYLSGPDGLLLLLDALAGTGSEQEVDQALGSLRGSLRWNRQFLELAKAVHAGRSGTPEIAEQHAATARAASEIYPMALHLGSRLTASTASADGWGDPISGLRAAEVWFHENGIQVAARSCRDLLRTLGASVQQRREGAGAVPTPLRKAGITVREYEVGLLVGQHLGNRAIGDRLHISPRTVEKHVAALLGKLAVPDRNALITALRDGG
jgi:DNA-binding CsgD family transcriptional regulator